MERALQLAKQAATADEVPIGAVITQDEQIIGEGFNCPISTNDPTAHAEIIALRAAAVQTHNYRLLNAILYVTVEPCLMCAAAIENARIKKVFYGCEEPKTGALISHKKKYETENIEKPQWSFLYQGGIMSNEARKLMQVFFKARRK